MSTPISETKSEYDLRMADDGFGGLASEEEIQDNITSSLDDIVNVVTDSGDLPVTTTIRPNGFFTDANDLKEYLQNGGLLATNESGDAEPLSFVWVVWEFDDVLQQDVALVYIDSDTNG